MYEKDKRKVGKKLKKMTTVSKQAQGTQLKI